MTVKNWLRFHDINQAKKQDSLITYSTFLSNYLNDENAKDDLKWVRKRVRELQFASARKSGTRSSYQNFVLKHRNDREAAEMVSFAKANGLDMNKIKVTEDTTEASFSRNSFIYDFMSSMRQKINDPLGVRAKKRREINQR